MCSISHTLATQQHDYPDTLDTSVAVIE